MKEENQKFFNCETQRWSFCNCKTKCKKGNLEDETYGMDMEHEYF
ncbi:hypothetical protein [Galbibacter sp. BG1]